LRLVLKVHTQHIVDFAGVLSLCTNKIRTSADKNVKCM
jgi:hypothetical protein